MNDELRHNFHLLRPWGLLLVVPGSVLWWLERRPAMHQAVGKVIDPALLSQLVVGGDERGASTPVDLLLAGWIVGISPSPDRHGGSEPSPFAGSQPPP